MSTTHRIMAAAILLLSGSVPASAQQAPAGRTYDPANLETVSGTIVRLDRVRAPGGDEHAVHAQVRTATGTIIVHLGPAWYLETQTCALSTGDRVTIRGSRVTVGGKSRIAAATVRRGAETLVLRDSAGIPYWSAGPQGDPRRP